MSANKSIHITILRNILLQNDYITTNKLSKLIGVSPKTITNHMDKVYSMAKEKNLNLIAKKGKGFIIDNDLFFKQSIAVTLDNTDKIPYFKEERKLFLINLLLTTDEELRIPYIEYLLHISRPSIYKCLDSVSIWLSKYKIILHKKNYTGIFIDGGEKRIRLAAIDWYTETKEFLKKAKINKNYPDVLNLQKSLKVYDNTYDNKLINETIYEIQDLMGFKCIKTYMDKLIITLKISLYRIKQGKYINLSEKRKALVTSFDSDNNIPKISNILNSKFNISITEEEVMYLFSLFLAADTSDNKQFITEEHLNIALPTNLLKDIDTYLSKNLNINETLKSNFIEKLETDIQSQIAYQVGYDSDYLSQLAISKDKYPILHHHSCEILNIIKSTINLNDTERFMANLTYNLSTIILKSKRKLRGVLIHNCNSSEIEFIYTKLSMYLVEVDIIATYECSDTNLQIDNNEVDIILTTLDLDNITNIKTIKIVRPLCHYNIIYYNSIIHDYYEELNQNLILIRKNI